MPVAAWFPIVAVALVVAVRFHRSPRTRRLALTAFFTAFLIAGLAPAHIWPFNGWQLFSGTPAADSTVRVVQLVDASGAVHRYPAAAAPPVTMNALRLMARDMPDMPRGERRALACHLLASAADRARDPAPATGVMPAPLAFPEPSVLAGWPDPPADIDALRVSRRTLRFAGGAVADVDDDTVLEVSRAACS